MHFFFGSRKSPKKSNVRGRNDEQGKINSQLGINSIPQPKDRAPEPPFGVYTSETFEFTPKLSRMWVERKSTRTTDAGFHEWCNEFLCTYPPVCETQAEMEIGFPKDFLHQLDKDLMAVHFSLKIALKSLIDEKSPLKATVKTTVSSGDKRDSSSSSRQMSFEFETDVLKVVCVVLTRRPNARVLIKHKNVFLWLVKIVNSLYVHYMMLHNKKKSESSTDTRPAASTSKLITTVGRLLALALRACTLLVDPTGLWMQEAPQVAGKAVHLFSPVLEIASETVLRLIGDEKTEVKKSQKLGRIDMCHLNASIMLVGTLAHSNTEIQSEVIGKGIHKALLRYLTSDPASCPPRKTPLSVKGIWSDWNIWEESAFLVSPVPEVATVYSKLMSIHLLHVLSLARKDVCQNLIQAKFSASLTRILRWVCIQCPNMLEIDRNAESKSKAEQSVQTKSDPAAPQATTIPSSSSAEIKKSPFRSLLPPKPTSLSRFRDSPIIQPVSNSDPIRDLWEATRRLASDLRKNISRVRLKDTSLKFPIYVPASVRHPMVNVFFSELFTIMTNPELKASHNPQRIFQSQILEAVVQLLKGTQEFNESGLEGNIRLQNHPLRFYSLALLHQIAKVRPIIIETFQKFAVTRTLISAARTSTKALDSCEAIGDKLSKSTSSLERALQTQIFQVVLNLGLIGTQRHTPPVELLALMNLIQLYWAPAKTKPSRTGQEDKKCEFTITEPSTASNMVAEDAAVTAILLLSVISQHAARVCFHNTHLNNIWTAIFAIMEHQKTETAPQDEDQDLGAYTVCETVQQHKHLMNAHPDVLKAAWKRRSIIFQVFRMLLLAEDLRDHMLHFFSTNRGNTSTLLTRLLREPSEPVRDLASELLIATIQTGTSNGEKSSLDVSSSRSRESRVHQAKGSLIVEFMTIFHTPQVQQARDVPLITRLLGCVRRILTDTGSAEEQPKVFCQELLWRQGCFAHIVGLLSHIMPHTNQASAQYTTRRGRNYLKYQRRRLKKIRKARELNSPRAADEPSGIKRDMKYDEKKEKEEMEKKLEDDTNMKVRQTVARSLSDPDLKTEALAVTDQVLQTLMLLMKGNAEIQRFFHREIYGYDLLKRILTHFVDTKHTSRLYDTLFDFLVMGKFCPVNCFVIRNPYILPVMFDMLPARTIAEQAEFLALFTHIVTNSVLNKEYCCRANLIDLLVDMLPYLSKQRLRIETEVTAPRWIKGNTVQTRNKGVTPRDSKSALMSRSRYLIDASLQVLCIDLIRVLGVHSITVPQLKKLLRVMKSVDTLTFKRRPRGLSASKSFKSFSSFLSPDASPKTSPRVSSKPRGQHTPRQSLDSLPSLQNVGRTASGTNGTRDSLSVLAKNLQVVSTRPAYNPIILGAIERMFVKSGGRSPDAFWHLEGRNSGLRIPPFSWPRHGFAFSIWFQLTSFREEDEEIELMNISVPRSKGTAIRLFIRNKHILASITYPDGRCSYVPTHIAEMTGVISSEGSNADTKISSTSLSTNGSTFSLTNSMSLNSFASGLHTINPSMPNLHNASAANSSQRPIEAGTWNHVALSFSRRKVLLRVNGSKSETKMRYPHFGSNTRLNCLVASDDRREGYGFHGQLGPVKLFKEALSNDELKHIRASGPNRMISDTLCRKMLRAYSAKARTATGFANTNPYGNESDEKTYARPLLPGTHTCITRNIKDIIHCLGGIRVLFPISEQLDQPVRTTKGEILVVNDGKIRTEKSSFGRSGDFDVVVNDNNAVDRKEMSLVDHDEEEDSESSDDEYRYLHVVHEVSYEPDPDFVRRILRLMRIMITRDPTNEIFMRQHKGFALIAFILEKLSPLSLTRKVVLEVDHLLGDVKKLASKADLVFPVYWNIMGNANLWVYTPVDTQETWMTLLNNNSGILIDDPSHDVVQKVIDNLRQVCWYEPEGGSLAVSPNFLHPITGEVIGQRPKEQAVRRIRSVFLETIRERMIRRATSQDILSLLLFMETSRDDKQRLEVTELLLQFIDDVENPVKFSKNTRNSLKPSAMNSIPVCLKLFTEVEARLRAMIHNISTPRAGRKSARGLTSAPGTASSSSTMHSTKRGTSSKYDTKSSMSILPVNLKEFPVVTGLLITVIETSGDDILRARALEVLWRLSEIGIAIELGSVATALEYILVQKGIPLDRECYAVLFSMMLGTRIHGKFEKVGEKSKSMLRDEGVKRIECITRSLDGNQTIKNPECLVVLMRLASASSSPRIASIEIAQLAVQHLNGLLMNHKENRKILTKQVQWPMWMIKIMKLTFNQLTKDKKKRERAESATTFAVVSTYCVHILQTLLYHNLHTSNGLPQWIQVLGALCLNPIRHSKHGSSTSFGVVPMASSMLEHFSRLLTRDAEVNDINAITKTIYNLSTNIVGLVLTSEEFLLLRVRNTSQSLSAIYDEKPEESSGKSPQSQQNVAKSPESEQNVVKSPTSHQTAAKSDVAPSSASDEERILNRNPSPPGKHKKTVSQQSVLSASLGTTNEDMDKSNNSTKSTTGSTTKTFARPVSPPTPPMPLELTFVWKCVSFIIDLQAWIVEGHTGVNNDRRLSTNTSMNVGSARQTLSAKMSNAIRSKSSIASGGGLKGIFPTIQTPDPTFLMQQLEELGQVQSLLEIILRIAVTTKEYPYAHHVLFATKTTSHLTGLIQQALINEEKTKAAELKMERVKSNLSTFEGHIGMGLSRLVSRDDCVRTLLQMLLKVLMTLEESKNTKSKAKEEKVSFKNSENGPREEKEDIKVQDDVKKISISQLLSLIAHVMKCSTKDWPRGLKKGMELLENVSNTYGNDEKGKSRVDECVKEITGNSTWIRLFRQLRSDSDISNCILHMRGKATRLIAGARQQCKQVDLQHNRSKNELQTRMNSSHASRQELSASRAIIETKRRAHIDNRRMVGKRIRLRTLQHILRELSNERGPWCPYNDTDVEHGRGKHNKSKSHRGVKVRKRKRQFKIVKRPRMFWKMDKTETCGRERIKLKVQYNGSSHEGCKSVSKAEKQREEKKKAEEAKRNAWEGNDAKIMDVIKVSLPLLKLKDKSTDKKKTSLKPSHKMDLDELLKEDEELNEDTSFDNDVKLRCECVMMTPAYQTPGFFIVTQTHVHFEVDEEKANKKEENKWVVTQRRQKWEDSLPQGYDRKWEVSSIRGLMFRRKKLRHTALEIFFEDGTNCFFNFESRKMRRRVYRKVIAVLPPPNDLQLSRNYFTDVLASNLKFLYKRPAGIMEDPAKLLERSGLTKKWQEHQISNFEYLMLLNTLAGRSYNDLSQYPVMPWVIRDYTSKVLDLTDPSTFRNLALPIGAQSAERLETHFLPRFREWDQELMKMPPFMYGTHYSSPGYVLFYMIRMEPFTTQGIKLQSGSFDEVDRIFHSIPTAWHGCQTGSGDVKELIPEWYYQPEIFRNINGLDMGTRSDGEKLGDVKLPPWASSPEEFVRINREALESEYVSEHLHHWIDLIFGDKQQGPKAEKSYNVYCHYTYENAVDIDKITDEVQKVSVLMQIEEFGQCPSQLFTKPHPTRFTQEGIDVSIINKLNSVKMYVQRQVTKGRIVFLAVRNECVISIGADRFIGIHKWRNATADFIPPFHFEVERKLRSKQRRLKDFDRGMINEIDGRLLAVSKDGSRVFSCGHWDNSLKIYQTETGRLVRSLTSHNDVVTCLAYSRNNRVLVTGSRDTTVHVWILDSSGNEIVGNHPKHILYGHDDEVNCVAVDVNLDVVVSGSRDGSCIVHTLRGATYVRSIYPPGESVPIRWVGISPNGLILTYSRETLTLNSFSINGRLLKSSDTKAHLTSFYFSENGKFLITGGYRGRRKGILKAIACHSLKIKYREETPLPIHTIGLSTIERHLLVGLEDGTVMVFALNEVVMRQVTMMKLEMIGF